MTSHPSFNTEPARSGAAPVLDRSKIKSLHDLLGSEKAAIALQKFRQDMEAHVAAIAKQATPVDEKGMRAHQLVGTAGTIGLDELSELSRRFEQAVNQNVDDLGPFIDQLVAAAARAKEQLDGIK